MASQSGTRYEDRTMQRGAAGGGAIAAHMNNSAAGYMVRFVNKQTIKNYDFITILFCSLKKFKCKICLCTVVILNKLCMLLMAITW